MLKKGALTSSLKPYPIYRKSSLVSYTFPLNPTFIFIKHYSVGCATRFKNPTFHLLGNLEWFVVQRTLKGKHVGAELAPNAVTAYESWTQMSSPTGNAGMTATKSLHLVPHPSPSWHLPISSIPILKQKGVRLILMIEFGSNLIEEKFHQH